MKRIKALIFLVAALLGGKTLPAQILKGSGLLYFAEKAHLDAFPPSEAAGSEIAFVVADTTLYRWSRDAEAWVKITTAKVYVSTDTSTIAAPYEGDVAYVGADSVFFRGQFEWLLLSADRNGNTKKVSMDGPMVHYLNPCEANIDLYLSGTLFYDSIRIGHNISSLLVEGEEAGFVIVGITEWPGYATFTLAASNLAPGSYLPGIYYAGELLWSDAVTVTAGGTDTVTVFDPPGQDSILVTRVCGTEISRDTILPGNNTVGTGTGGTIPIWESSQELGDSDIRLIDDIRTWSYRQSASVNAEEAAPQSLYVTPDGTKMFMIGTTGYDVNEYTLSVPHDISTRVFTGVTLASGEASPSGLAFKPDGTEMYIIGTSNDMVRQFTFATPWSLATATFTAQSAAFSTDDANPRGLHFAPDGTKMWTCGDTGGEVNQYALSPAWDATTITYDATYTFSFGTETERGVSFINSGATMLVSNSTTGIIRQFSLGTPWDIGGTVTYTGYNTPIIPVSNNAALLLMGDFHVDEAAGKAYAVVLQTDEVSEWDIGEGYYVETVPNLVVGGGLNVQESANVIGNLAVGGTGYFSGALTTTGTIKGSNITGTNISTGSTVASLYTATTTGTASLGASATTSGNTKTINIGTGGLAGSTTTTTIGTNSGGSGSVTINNPVTLPASSAGAAGTAPLTFTLPSAQLVTPAAGRLEPSTDGARLLYTDDTPTRHELAYVDEIASVAGTNLGAGDVPGWDGSEFQPSGITDDGALVTIARDGISVNSGLDGTTYYSEGEMNILSDGFTTIEGVGIDMLSTSDITINSETTAYLIGDEFSQVGVSNETALYIDRAGLTATLGDYSLSGNGTKIDVNDDSEEIIISSGTTYIGTSDVLIGDYAQETDGTSLHVSVNGGAITLGSLTTGPQLLLDSVYDASASGTAYFKDMEVSMPEISHYAFRPNYEVTSINASSLNWHRTTRSNASIFEEGVREYVFSGSDTITVDTFDFATQHPHNDLMADSIGIAAGGLITNQKSTTVTWLVDYSFFVDSDEDDCYAFWDLTTDGSEEPERLEGSASRSVASSTSGVAHPGNSFTVNVPSGQAIRLCLYGNIGVTAGMDISYLKITILQLAHTSN